MRSYGNTGGGGSNHGGSGRGLLDGVAGHKPGQPVVYPDNKCATCERSGRIIAESECLRLHWRGPGTPSEGDPAASITTSN